MRQTRTLSTNIWIWHGQRFLRSIPSKWDLSAFSPSSLSRLFSFNFECSSSALHNIFITPRSERFAAGVRVTCWYIIHDIFHGFVLRKSKGKEERRLTVSTRCPCFHVLIPIYCDVNLGWQLLFRSGRKRKLSKKKKNHQTTPRYIYTVRLIYPNQLHLPIVFMYLYSFLFQIIVKWIYQIFRTLTMNYHTAEAKRRPNCFVV